MLAHSLLPLCARKYLEIMDFKDQKEIKGIDERDHKDTTRTLFLERKEEVWG